MKRDTTTDSETPLDPAEWIAREEMRQPRQRTRLWPLVWLGTLLIVLSGGLLSLRFVLDTPVRTVQATSRALGDLASAFQQGQVVTSFLSYGASITNYHYLQVATLKQTELFRRSETPLTGFGFIPLPGVEVEARAPVQYTYYLDLHDRWEFVLRDHVLYVFAPPIRFNRPAVDVSAMDIEVQRGYLSADGARERLKQTITGMVVHRARENIPLVREHARRQLAEFVETWLARSFSDGEVYAVKVIFPDEPAAPQLAASDQVARTPLIRP